MDENKNLNENQMNEAPEVKEAKQPEAKPTAQSGINKNVLIIAIAAVLIVAIIAVALVAILGGNNDDDKDDDEKTSDSDKKDDDDDLVVTEGLEFVINSDGTYTLMSLGSAGKEKTIVIPKVYNERLVTAIDADAFKNNTTVKTVVIPDSVKVIDAPIFAGCSSLESLTIPYIAGGEQWFNDEYGDYVSGLSKLFGTSNSDIPESLTKVVINSGDRVEDYAFYECKDIENVAISDSVTSIGDSAFRWCTSLTSITIPGGVTSIGDSAFWYCSSLTSITIPEGVTSIGDYAFRWCTSLTNIKVDENNTAFKSIDGNLYSKDGKTLIQYTLGKQDAEFVIPEGVTSIGDYAFSNCDSLTSITIPGSVTSIGSYAFLGCTSLTSITISEGVTSIGNSAFFGCSSLTSITIPEGVTSIGDSAFYLCTSLTSITIPEGVTSIGESAIVGCSSLTDVYYTGSEAEWNKISIGGNNGDLTSATIHYNYVP